MFAEIRFNYKSRTIENRRCLCTERKKEKKVVYNFVRCAAAQTKANRPSECVVCVSEIALAFTPLSFWFEPFFLFIIFYPVDQRIAHSEDSLFFPVFSLSLSQVLSSLPQPYFGRKFIIVLHLTVLPNGFRCFVLSPQRRRRHRDISQSPSILSLCGAELVSNRFSLSFSIHFECQCGGTHSIRSRCEVVKYAERVNTMHCAMHVLARQGRFVEKEIVKLVRFHCLFGFFFLSRIRRRHEITMTSMAMRGEKQNGRNSGVIVEKRERGEVCVRKIVCKIMMEKWSESGWCRVDASTSLAIAAAVANTYFN